MNWITISQLFIFLIIAQQINAQEGITFAKSTPFTIGETVSFHSKILQQNRTLNIYLPNSYHPDSTKQYPVIYLLDGSKDEDFIHIAGLVQFASFPWIQTIPETIVVGIANVDRKHDFTFPSSNEKDKEYLPTNGGSADFIHFLATEVQPFIDHHYPTNTNSQTLIGQSLGGLLATEILFKQPDLFDNYIIVSPSMWWDEESLLGTTPMPYTSNKGIYIAVGKEGPVMEKGAKDLFEKLEESKTNTTQLFFKYFENLDHGDTLHLAVYEALKELFKK